MARETLPTFGLVVWTSDSDGPTREDFEDNFRAIDEQGATDASVAQAIDDERGVQSSWSATQQFDGGIVLQNGASITFDDTVGGRIGTATNLLSFYGATPTTQPTAYTINATGGSPAKTLSAYSTSNRSASFTSTPAALTNAATLADLNTLRASYEILRASSDEQRAVIAQLVADLKQLGLTA